MTSCVAASADFPSGDGYDTSRRGAVAGWLSDVGFAGVVAIVDMGRRMGVAAERAPMLKRDAFAERDVDRRLAAGCSGKAASPKWAASLLPADE